MECDTVHKGEASESTHRHRHRGDSHHRTDLEGYWPASLIASGTNIERPRFPHPSSKGKVHHYTQVQDTRTEGGDLRGKGINQVPSPRPAIEQLHLIQRITAVAKELTSMEEFFSFFQGLRKIEGEYTIQLEDDAKPFALSTP